MSTTMPYTDGDVHELQPVGGAEIGTYTTGDAGSTEKRTFRVPYAKKGKFLAAMLGVARLPDQPTMIAESAHLRGRGPGPVKSAGSGEFEEVVFEIEYKPKKAGEDKDKPQGQDNAVQIESSIEYVTEAIGLPDKLWFQYKAGNAPGTSREIANGLVGVPLTVTRKHYTIKNLRSFNEAGAYDVAGCVDNTKKNVRLSTLHVPNITTIIGVLFYTVNFSIDIRPSFIGADPWQKYYIPSLGVGSWGYYYTDKARTHQYLPFAYGDVTAFVKTLGVSL